LVKIVPAEVSEAKTEDVKFGSPKPKRGTNSMVNDEYMKTLKFLKPLLEK
jgi:hypothetical protein